MTFEEVYEMGVDILRRKTQPGSYLYDGMYNQMVDAVMRADLTRDEKELRNFLFIRLKFAVTDTLRGITGRDDKRRPMNIEYLAEDWNELGATPGEDRHKEVLEVLDRVEWGCHEKEFLDRHLAGASHAGTSEEFGVNPSRVSQVVSAAKSRARYALAAHGITGV